MSNQNQTPEIKIIEKVAKDINEYITSGALMYDAIKTLVVEKNEPYEEVIATSVAMLLYNAQKRVGNDLKTYVMNSIKDFVAKAAQDGYSESDVSVEMYIYAVLISIGEYSLSLNARVKLINGRTTVFKVLDNTVYLADLNKEEFERYQKQKELVKKVLELAKALCKKD